MKLLQTLNPLKARWAQMASREQRLVAAALAVVGLALVWAVALAPALRVLGQSRAQHAQLDAEREQLQQLAAQAKTLQGMPKLGFDEALRALQASTAEHLGAGSQVNASGDRVSVTLKAVQPQALAQWLVQARSNARALATDMRLTQTPGGWDGVVVMALPAR